MAHYVFTVKDQSSQQPIPAAHFIFLDPATGEVITSNGAAVDFLTDQMGSYTMDAAQGSLRFRVDATDYDYHDVTVSPGVSTILLSKKAATPMAQNVKTFFQQYKNMILILLAILIIYLIAK